MTGGLRVKTLSGTKIAIRGDGKSPDQKVIDMQLQAANLVYIFDVIILSVTANKSSFKGDNSKGCKGEQPFLHVTHRFHLIYMSTKDHKNISKGIKVIECTSFLL